MYLRMAVMRLLPKHREAYLSGLKEEAYGANTAEPLNVDYHVWLGDPDESTVVIYQVYKNRDGYLAHIDTPHTQIFRKLQRELREQGEPPTENILSIPLGIPLAGTAANPGGLVLGEAKNIMPADKDWRTKGVRLL